MRRDPLLWICAILACAIVVDVAASIRAEIALDELDRQHFPADVRIDPQ